MWMKEQFVITEVRSGFGTGWGGQFWEVLGGRIRDAGAGFPATRRKGAVSAGQSARRGHEASPG